MVYLLLSRSVMSDYAIQWTAAPQASLFSAITGDCSNMSIKLMMVSHPLLPHSPLALNLSQHQGFSNESVLHIRWPKYWSFRFSISPSNEYSGLISFRMDWLDLLQSKGLSRVFSNTTVQKHQFFSDQLSL